MISLFRISKRRLVNKIALGNHSLKFRNQFKRYMAEIKVESNFTNRLINEKSPYLLQHAHNPVDWYPWGEEAIEKARRENKVIFLSVGYSTCHWCHVMAHESFEDENIAKIMNENFVNIKIDREERPDIDKIYMSFVVSLHGSGGWPMSVFIDPYSLGPFTGGTYFPPVPRYGSISFPQLLEKVAKLWKEQSQSLKESGENIAKALKNLTTESDSGYEPNVSILEGFFKNAKVMYDREYGGFSNKPKFPTPVMFTGLLNYYKVSKNEDALEMCKKTLLMMANGGINDQLGGGFHRYSVTRDWLVPHFEKMLYDQSQLIVAYLDIYQFTRDEFYSKVAKDIMNYLLTQMKDEKNGIYSAEDADSLLPEDPTKHGEGAFYTWKKSEIMNVLGETDGNIFCMRYGVEENGNVNPIDDPHNEFKNKNILHVTTSIRDIANNKKMEESEVKESLKRSITTLFNHREKRPRPHLDDKILTEWNALTISAFAKAYTVLGDKSYLNTAYDIIKFLKTELYDEKSKTLLRSYRHGPSDIKGFANDYAALICALIDTYEAGFDINHLIWARELQDRMIDLFYDNVDGGFFNTGDKDPHIITRMKDNHDNTEPSPNSLGIMNLLRLHQFTNNDKYYDYALKTIKCFASQLQNAPAIAPYMASTTRMFTNKMQIIIAGDKDAEDTKALIKTVHDIYEPAKVLIYDDSGEGRKVFQEWGHPMFTTDDLKISGKACAYVCKNFTCNMPVTTPEELSKLIE